MLSNDQKYAFELMDAGYNIFLTGEAGTGKSYLISEFINQCEKQHKQTMIVAPTGIAAINVNGVTIHRAFKAPIGPLIDKPKSISKTLLSTDILICDEISMCRVDLFDYMLHQIMQTNMYRRNHGKKDIQIIVVGDFFQLPPVLPPKDLEVLKYKYESIDKGYAFESSYWDCCNFKYINLTEPMRQNNENFLLNLNKSRKGDKSCIAWFNRNSKQEYDEDAISVVGKNQTAEEINTRKINELDGSIVTYIADVDGNVKDSDKVAPEIIDVKIGARVMMLINDAQGKFSNGSFGTVKRLSKNAIFVEMDDTGVTCKIEKYTWEILDYTVSKGKLEAQVIGTYKQFPLKIGYAITIHKSQGQTYERVNIDPRCWDSGQLYVALSRCKSIDNMHFMTPVMNNYLVTSEKVKELYKKFD